MPDNEGCLSVALLHHPVLNRRGETIASAITNLDLHDLARLACTYGISRCYIVTPLKDQQDLAQRLLRHWSEGIGQKLHPDRDRALRCLRIVADLAAAKSEIASRCGQSPTVWATTAVEQPDALSLQQARQRLLESGIPRLVLFGTGWGLAPSVLAEADAVLETIRGRNGYNHLSVRCAAAILLDRLLYAG